MTDYTDYEVIEQIAWKGDRPIHLVKKDGNRYALKPEKTHSVKRTVELLDGHSHPNVLSLVDYSVDPGYTVSEYCEEGTLRGFEVTGWTDTEKLDLCFQVFEGMEWIHNRGFNKHNNDPKNVFIKTGNIPVVGDLESLQKVGNGVAASGGMSAIYTFFYKRIEDRALLSKLGRRKQAYNKR